MSEELRHRRSSVFIDEYVDKYTIRAISWNGDERLHLTVGRDSLEVVSEHIVPDPSNPEKAVLKSGSTTAYRNDVASLAIPMDVAEDLAVAILNVVEQAKKRAARDPLI